MIKKLQSHIFWSIELITLGIIFIIMCVYNYSYISYTLHDEASVLRYCTKTIENSSSQIDEYLDIPVEELIKGDLVDSKRNSNVTNLMVAIINADINILKLDSSGRITSSVGYISEEDPESVYALIEESRTSRNTGLSAKPFLISTVDKGTFCYMILLDRTNWRNDILKHLGLSLALLAFAAALLGLAAKALAAKISAPVEDAIKRQTRFVADASHELKTPVSVINANISILEQEYGNNRWMEYIKGEGSRMTELVNQLLQLSRIDHESSVIDKLSSLEHFDAYDAISEAYLPFDSLAFEKGAHIDARLLSEQEITGSRGDFIQILKILLDNAVNHVNPSGEILISTEVEADRMSVKRGGKKFTLTVSNTGDPIPAEDLPYIFDRFYKSKNNRPDTGNNFGLGLSIARSLAHRNKYELRATSSGELTQFILEINI